MTVRSLVLGIEMRLVCGVGKVSSDFSASCSMIPAEVLKAGLPCTMKSSEKLIKVVPLRMENNISQ